MSRREYNPSHEKFISEIESFCRGNRSYKLGEILHSITIQINKTGVSLLNVEDNVVLECIEKAILSERNN